MIDEFAWMLGHLYFVMRVALNGLYIAIIDSDKLRISLETVANFSGWKM